MKLNAAYPISTPQMNIFQLQNFHSIFFQNPSLQWCLSSLSSSCSELASPQICDAFLCSRNQDSLPSEDWFIIWEWSLFCQAVNLVQDCVPEIAEIIFRPNSINIAFYYPRKNHKTLVTASCIPTLWKTFMTSVSIFTSMPPFSLHYMEQLVTMLLDCHPFCTTKILISSESISTFLVLSQLRLCVLFTSGLWSVARTKYFSSSISKSGNPPAGTLGFTFYKWPFLWTILPLHSNVLGIPSTRVNLIVTRKCTTLLV